MPSKFKLALIGDNISKSKAAVTHKEFAKQFDLEVDYKFVEAPKNLQEAIKSLVQLGYIGVNITSPYKIEALEKARIFTKEASQIRATNTLRLLPNSDYIAHNTDGAGFIKDIYQNLQWDFKNARILILGAGGAVRAILPYIISKKPGCIFIANRTFSKAEALCKRLNKVFLVPVRYEELSQCLPFDFVVNATSASLTNAMPYLPTNILTKATYCYDYSYIGQDTEFIKWAKKHGCFQVSDGFNASIEQAAFAFEFWFGKKPATFSMINIYKNT